MMRTFFLLILLLGLTLPGVTQPIVEEITFSGLRRTQDAFLRRFVTTEVGAPLDSARLEADRQRLTYLEPLADVQYIVSPRDSGAVAITLECTELRTLLPIFGFGGIRENFWVQAGATDVNLGGRGQKLTAYYQYYDRHSVGLHYQVPWLKNSPWGWGVNLVRWSTVEPLYFPSGSALYNYDNRSYGLDLIYNLNFTDRLILNGTYFTEQYDRHEETMLMEAPVFARLHKGLVKLIYERNRMEQYFFYRHGYALRVNTEGVGALDDQGGDFLIAFAEFQYLRTFRQAGGQRFANMAHRLKVGLSTNEETPFAPFVLDSYVNIRGVGNRVDRGTGMVVLNSEYRHTLTEQKYWAAQAVAFSDFGMWRQPGGTMADFGQVENQQWFVGGGLRLILKPVYQAIIRVDYGYDVLRTGNSGFTLGVGQYF